MTKKIWLSIVFLLLIDLILIGCGQKVEQIQSHSIEVQGSVGGNSNIAIPDLKDIKNTKYPGVVAEVGDKKITGLQLTREVAIKKITYANNLKPQAESFYEKVALGLLVKNALIDNEVKKQGLTATAEEANSSLEQQKKSMDSLPDNDPAKEAYIQAIKANGFNNSTDYSNSPEMIKITQILLGRGKLRNLVLQSIPTGQNEAFNAWQNYTDKLINEGNYKIFIPVDIKGFQQLEENVAKSLKAMPQAGGTTVPTQVGNGW